MPDVCSVHDRTPKEIVRAYTDMHLCYCPECAYHLGYDGPSECGPNWLPFLPITRPDEIPEKYCDSCERILPRD